MNFDAVAGTGLRDRGYNWTSSVFLELASRVGQREHAGASKGTVSQSTEMGP